eukprot:scaffold6121_cov170-Amphora_coffeaeformis.AAC.5
MSFDARYHEDEDDDNDAEDSQALILFDAALMKRMQTTHRLPGTYIGVRRIRPSSKHVHRAHVKNKKQKLKVPPPTPIEFKVLDPQTGQERRMTAAEKKVAKQEWMRNRQLQKQQAKAQKQKDMDEKDKEVDLGMQQQNEAPEEQNEEEEEEEKEKLEPASLETRVAQAPKNHQYNREDQEKYYYFKINKTSLEQELADLRGDRNGVPPILLSPGQAHVAKSHNLVPDIATAPIRNILLDDAFAKEWATALRASMMPAIQTRKSEDMRGMVYDIAPQVWTRLRPTFGDHEPREESNSQPTESGGPLTLQCTIRSPSSINKDWNILMEALYQGTGIHIGCGAKFGCDILLYDGPRCQRHSFAGLRLVQSTGTGFPLPRAYDLAGYVRCLNTAGKLALLATVIQDNEQGPSVSIIDLALEKIDLKRKPKPSKTLEQRVETLAKTKS